jgi:hypothetical protein
MRRQFHDAESLRPSLLVSIYGANQTSHVQHIVDHAKKSKGKGTEIFPERHVGKASVCVQRPTARRSLDFFNPWPEVAKKT